MAITLPTPQQLSLFSHGETDVFTNQQASQAIQQSADLLYLATGATEDTGDATVDRIISWGLMDMAWSLLIGTDNKTETYSPYSGERIGSYSYSKALGQVRNTEGTGVQWFDAAVDLLNTETPGDGAVWTVSETVFAQPFCRSEQSSTIHVHDPSFPEPVWSDAGGWVSP